MTKTKILCWGFIFLFCAGAVIFQVIARVEHSRAAAIRAETATVWERIGSTGVPERLEFMPGPKVSGTFLSTDEDYLSMRSGCKRHQDGHVTQSCRVRVCDAAAVACFCILDDATVCLGECELCVKKVDGEWREVSGWYDELRTSSGVGVRRFEVSP